MDFLMIIVLVGVIAFLIPKEGTTDNAPAKEKFCPPHKWRHEDIVDHDGNVCAQRIICDRCGPLKVSEDER